MKVVINKCFGGFELSKAAMDWLAIRGEHRWDGDIERNNPLLIEVVETLKYEANGDSADLRVVEIPDNVKWEIDDYDGIESIHEEHRSWG